MINKNKKKIIVGMSGGVDSSVSAWLLLQEGYQVEGLFMKNWEEDDNEQYCIAKKDLDDATSVCKTLGIKLHKVNFAAEYLDNVFVHCLSAYQSGLTPNPDILCNKEIKFKEFLKFSHEVLGADFIATGHYVRRVDVNGKSQLLRSIDNTKDQSYFLYTIDHEQLTQCLFPMDKFNKNTVRYIANKLGLVTANKKDFTGICFIGKRNFRHFLSRYIPENPGVIISVDGQEIGCHQGLMYYTLGQRKGLDIGGIRNTKEEPWYVVDKNLNTNQLIVAQGRFHPQLMSTGLVATQLHWISRQSLTEVMRCTVKTRYRQPDISCVVIPMPDGRLQVNFDQPVAAVTPGQSAVFYLSDRCLGGRIIESRQALSY